MEFYSAFKELTGAWATCLVNKGQC